MRKSIIAVALAATLGLTACGKSTEDHVSNVNKEENIDQRVVQLAVNEKCGREGVQALTSVEHASYGKTSGWLLICKATPTRVDVIGR